MALRRALVGLLPKALGASPAQALAPICSSSSALMQSVTSTSTSSSSHVPHSFRELWRSYATDLAAPAKQSSAPCTKLSMTPSHLISYDEHSHARHPPSADAKPFTYLVVAGGRFMYASAIRLFVLKFVMSLSAAADVLALSSLEVDLANIEEGQTVTVKWRGKPVFIKHRTDEEIAKANAVDVAGLRDAQTDAERVVNPKYLIVVGICTHLGCVPIAGAGEFGGWFCPCHGSHYDVSGRIRKGPAPYNLEVPEYRFLDDTKIVVG